MTTEFTPIFIIGSARSGTTLTARVLFSHPRCAEYRAETLMLSVCKLKYGNIFRDEKKRKIFLKGWFNSRQFKESKLSQSEFLVLLERSYSYENLLVKFLNEIRKKSGSEYVVDSTPAHGLFISEIYKECPQAKFINIIRDPRSVAISQNKLGWSNPPAPFKSNVSHLHYCVAQWTDLMERVEREKNSGIPILTIRYEDLLNYTDRTLEELATFLSLKKSDLDTSIISTGSESNSAFGKIGDSRDKNNPLNRWKSLDNETSNAITYGCESALERYGYSMEPKATAPYQYIRYQYFKIHIKAKRLFVKIPYFGRFISSSLEILS